AWGACPTDVSTYAHGATIAARATDNAGNTGPSSTVTIQRDTQAPGTAISAISPEYRNTPPQLFFNPTSDGGSPFTTIRLLGRQAPADPWTDRGALTNGMSWTPPTQGRWYVASKVTDEAGNVEPDPTGATDDATFFYDTLAPSAPTVSAVGPSNSRNPNVAWSASTDPGAPTTGSGVQTYRVFILRPDNSLAAQYDVAAPTTNGSVPVALDDGNYIARVVAIDVAGNQSAASPNFPFTVDSITVFSGRAYSDTAPLGYYNGESGVAGVPVTLTHPTSAISTTATNALGDYSFGGLETPGFYTITIAAPAGYVRTTPDEQRRLVVLGSDFPNIHFGLRYIGNQNTQFLWVNTQCTDGSPFPNAPFTVQGPALNTSAATGAEGGWAAEVSQPGVYTVTLIDTGIPLVAPGDVNPVAVTVPADGSGGATFVLDCSNINEGTGAISVRLYDADNIAATPALFANQTVTASNGISTLVGTTNAAGYVTFVGLISGTWTVTAPAISGQWLVLPALQAYVQPVNVVAPLASQLRYGYRAQSDAVSTRKLSEDLSDNGALYVGDVVRYTLAVTNSTGVTLTNVRITDTLPGGLTFGGIESVTPAGCNAGENAGQVLALCPTLGDGEAMRVVFTATVSSANAPLVNSFVWSADELDSEQPGDGCTNAPCGGPDPRLSFDNVDTRKTADPTSVRMGEQVTYTIVVSNAGSAAVTVQITDTLAVSATLLSATPGYAQSGQTLVWSGVVVPAGGTATVTITVQAEPGPAGGYVLNNSVVIGAADGQITRDAPGVTVRALYQAFVPIAMHRWSGRFEVYLPIVMR
ncbi:MAG: SdrD B-like domain-containing protein, partial [Anaerolineae bacterium]